MIKIKDGIPSDHRVLWVELSLIDVFGANDIITKKVTKLTFKFSKGKSLQSWSYAYDTTILYII